MTEVQKLAKIMVLKDLYKEYELLAKYNGGIDYDRYCALEMAIKALEQQTCEDTISRKALIERINNAEENFKHDNIESISSGDENPFVDGVLSGVFNIRQMVSQAPPVQPELETGYWLRQDEGAYYPVECSICHKEAPVDDFGYIESPYCPNCGHQMKGEMKRNDT